MSSALAGQYVDLQVNGYVGVDFNDPTTSPADIEQSAIAMRHSGVAKALPTVITRAPEVMEQCLRNLRQATVQYPTAAEVFVGFHVEGPFLSGKPGYVGAHPKQHVVAASIDLMQRFERAAEGMVRLVTLAPEVTGAVEVTRYCVDQGILVAAGHTDASIGELEKAVDSGLKLFTHLCNACPPLMDRHDNIIYRALNLADRLHYSLIADSFHVPKTLFQNLLNWVPIERLLVVSDAISAAGLGAGEFQLGEKTVLIGEDGAARDSSGEHFVGSATSMQGADDWLATELELSTDERRQLLVTNPQQLLDASDSGDSCISDVV